MNIKPSINFSESCLLAPLPTAAVVSNRDYHALHLLELSS